MQYYQNVLAYFATALNYARKTCLKLAPNGDKYASLLCQGVSYNCKAFYSGHHIERASECKIDQGPVL